MYLNGNVHQDELTKTRKNGENQVLQQRSSSQNSKVKDATPRSIVTNITSDSFNDYDYNSQKKVDEYIDGFTVHGLSRIFHGNRYESIFWSIVVICGILLTIVVTTTMFKKYFRYEVYTEVRSQVTHENRFPAFSICENGLLKTAYFAYCSQSIRSVHNRNKYCTQNLNDYTENVTSIEGSVWYNQFFHINECYTWDGQNCLSTKYFKSIVRYNNSCFQFNYDGSINDLYSHVILKFTFKSPAFRGKIKPNLVVIPHDHRIHDVDLTSTVAIEPHKKYYIVMDKTENRRLPSPYPSNCSEEKQGDIFPGIYGRRQCIESHSFKRMYKTCGTVIDYIHQYLPKDFLEKYKKNQTILEAIQCIKGFKDVKITDIKDCSFPCHEVEFGMVTSFTNDYEAQENDPSVVDFSYTMDLNYHVVDTYRIYEEKVLYNWEQMAAEIGGFVGLVIGASIISLVEIIVCLGIKSFTTWKKKRRYRKPYFRKGLKERFELCLNCTKRLSKIDEDEEEYL